MSFEDAMRVAVVLYGALAMWMNLATLWLLRRRKANKDYIQMMFRMSIVFSCFTLSEVGDILSRWGEPLTWRLATCFICLTAFFISQAPVHSHEVFNYRRAKRA